MEDYITNIIIFGVTSWTILFMLTRKMFHKRSFKFSGNLIAIIHSLTFVFLSSYTVPDWTNPITPLASISSPLQMKVLAADLAYYIFDFGCFQFGPENVPIDYIIHHIVAIAALIVGVTYGRWGSEAMAEIWIGEFPTPWFCLGQLLKELGYKDTNLYLAVDILYAAAFIFAKMICGTYLIYLVLSTNYPLICKVVLLAIQLLYAFWFYKHVRVCRYKYKFKQRRNSSQRLIQAS